VLFVVTYKVYEHFKYVETDNAQIFGHSVMLAPKVSGYVQKVNVTEGQKVPKDFVLIEIDPRDYENNLKQAKGELASIEARKRDAEKIIVASSIFFQKVPFLNSNMMPVQHNSTM